MRIPVVENPRRRRRRRRQYSPKQLAAGFGGKRYRKTSRRKHRNPDLAALAFNPRRRRSGSRRRRRSYSLLGSPRRNPRIGPFSFDLTGAAFVAGGMIGSKLGPTLIRKVWPGMPSSGLAYHGIRAGTVLLLGLGVKMLTRSEQRSQQVVAGGLGLIFFDLFNEYVAPAVGLAGLGDYVTQAELEDITGTGISGYVHSPQISGYMDVPMEQMAA